MKNRKKLFPTAKGLLSILLMSTKCAFAIKLIKCRNLKVQTISRQIHFKTLRVQNVIYGFKYSTVHNLLDLPNSPHKIATGTVILVSKPDRAADD